MLWVLKNKSKHDLQLHQQQRAWNTDCRNILACVYHDAAERGDTPLTCRPVLDQPGLPRGLTSRLSSAQIFIKIINERKLPLF